MTDDTPFIRTIMDRPHEVGPRLVFADFLEERGDVWAELIRLQCQLADSEDYEQAYTQTRGGFPHYGSETKRMLGRCSELLDRHTGEIVLRCISASGLAAQLQSFSACYGDLIWWRKADRSTKFSETSVFVWRGLPERLDATADQWLKYHQQHMAAFPFWYVKISNRWRSRLGNGADDVGPTGTFSLEDTLNVAVRYIGLITTLDLPDFMPTNAFSAWACNLLDACGEKCMAATGQPFTLKTGQSTMSGPAHSARERWQKYCDGWLKNSNVRVVSQLEARPAGGLTPIEDMGLSELPRRYRPSGTR